MSDHGSDPSAPGRSTGSKALWIAFAASAAVNLLGLGAAAGFVLGGGRHGPARGADFHEAANARIEPGAFSPRNFVAALPPETRRRLIGVAVERLRANQGLGLEVRAARDEAVAAFKADPFDPQKAEMALARFREAQAKLQNLSNSVLIEAAQALTAEQRIAIMERGEAAWRARSGAGGASDRWRGGADGAPASESARP